MASSPTDDPQANDYIIVGRLGAKYGVHGWQRLISYTSPVDNILHYSPLFLQKKHQWHALPSPERQSRGQNLYIRLPDCTTPEEAKCYTGLAIGIQKSQLPATAEDEYYWSELQGMAVYHQSGEYFGIVDYLIEVGDSDVLVIKGERNRMIPFIHTNPVVSVDRANRKIIVDWDPSI